MTIQMPEPVVLYSRSSPLGGATLDIKGYTDAHMKTYADARVREALEEVIRVIESEDDRLMGEIHIAAIRALIEREEV